MFYPINFQYSFEKAEVTTIRLSIKNYTLSHTNCFLMKKSLLAVYRKFSNHKKDAHWVLNKIDSIINDSLK